MNENVLSIVHGTYEGQVLNLVVINDTIKNYHLQLTQTEEVKYVLQTIDKAFYLFDQETVKFLEKQTYELMAKYE